MTGLPRKGTAVTFNGVRFVFDPKAPAYEGSPIKAPRWVPDPADLAMKINVNLDRNGNPFPETEWKAGEPWTQHAYRVGMSGFRTLQKAMEYAIARQRKEYEAARRTVERYETALAKTRK